MLFTYPLMTAHTEILAVFNNQPQGGFVTRRRSLDGPQMSR
jgi:hypothetical protein